MKLYLSTLIIAAGFFISTTSSAQMGYARPRNTAGMDRGIGVSQYSNGKKQKDKSKNNDNADLLYPTSMEGVSRLVQVYTAMCVTFSVLSSAF